MPFKMGRADVLVKEVAPAPSGTCPAARGDGDYAASEKPSAGSRI
ncbi:MAG TPA: hypothetical protein VEM76_07395 [Anaeromyxobacteraceae bacterium]|nr:hypothetical protein [Anaeromyxobacteraceae bacterium]